MRNNAIQNEILFRSLRICKDELKVFVSLIAIVYLIEQENKITI